MPQRSTETGSASTDVIAPSQGASRPSVSLNFSNGQAEQAFTNLYSAMKGGPLSALDTRLASLALQPMSSGLGSLSGARAAAAPERYLTIDVVAKDGNGAALLAQLQSLGLQQGASFGAMAGGLIPVSALAQLAGLDNVASARQSASHTSVGDVDSQVDPAGYSDDARGSYGVDGTGIKVGCISDSFNRLTGAATNMSDDIASGDLPADTVILRELPGSYPGTPTDEGRALAQVVHDIAPGSSIMFATGSVSMTSMARNILDLAAAGCKVIVDDVHFFNEPAYQDGIVAQAVNQVVEAGVVYVTAAYNNDNDGWEGTWHGREKQTFNLSNGEAVTYEFQDFAEGQNNLAVTFEEDGPASFTLKWDQPSSSAGGAGCTSDLDLFVFDADLGFIVAQSIEDNIFTGEPTEFILDFVGEAGKTYFLLVGHRVGSGPEPGRIKLMAETTKTNVDLEDTAWNLNDGTIYGHAAATGAITAGTAHYFDTPEFGGPNPPTLSEGSSMGPALILFDQPGNRLAQPETRNKPDVVGLDGGNTTFFGTDLPIDADAFPNFGGTSASAPHIAGIAALMLDARSTLTPEDIWAQMVNSTIDMDDPRTTGFDTGYDTATGGGMVNAKLAVGFASTLHIRNDVKDVLLGTHHNDRIIGATGKAQDLAAGDGDDRYDVGNIGTRVFEASAGGNDTVYTTVNLALASNQAVETLRANAGSTGLLLTGNNLKNTIVGGNGADTINGGAGVDILNGGANNDIFLVASAADHSSVEAIDGGIGSDRLRFTSTTAGQTLVLSNKVLGVESVAAATAAGSTAGTTALNLDGSALSYGLQLIGNNGANILTGTAFVDTLEGAAGKDILDGGLGADALAGGAGDDTYFVENSSDTITEANEVGTDIVRTTLNTYTLGANVEQVVFQGVGNFVGTGNAANNRFTGAAGATSSTLTGWVRTCSEAAAGPTVSSIPAQPRGL